MSGTYARPAMAENSQKPKSKASDRKDRTKAREAAYRANCQLVNRRDGFKCRACGVAIMGFAHHHHIRFRSQGRDDSTGNLALLCGICHADVHAYRLTITGNADSTLDITRNL